jgi:hypothetical protein
MINCYLIKSRVPNRYLPLSQCLKTHPDINVIEIDGYYLSESESKNVANTIWSNIRILRDLSVGEIGAALVHSHVQTIIADSGVGGVVLEDDARITDINKFYNACSNFLDFNLELEILNLYDTRAVKLSVSQINDIESQNKFVKLLGVSKLCVAYALSSASAEKLFNSNYPVYCTADWPYSSNKHVILLRPVVEHGDALTKSTIDELGALNRDKFNSIKNKIRIISFFDYFYNYKHFDNLNQYYRIVLKHRITFYLDMLKFKYQFIILIFKSLLSRLISPTYHR